MNKSDFLNELYNVLYGVPESEKILDYYNEMIDDRIEDGMNEEDAVKSLGSVDSIRNKILNETSLPKLIKAKSSVQLSGMAIALLVIGFPLWFPLLLAGGILVLAFFIVIFALIFCAYTLVISLALGGLAAVVIGLITIPLHLISSLFQVGSGLIMISLSIFLFYPAVSASRGLMNIIKIVIKWAKSLFIGKRGM